MAIDIKLSHFFLLLFFLFFCSANQGLAEAESRVEGGRERGVGGREGEGRSEERDFFFLFFHYFFLYYTAAIFSLSSRRQYRKSDGRADGKK